MKKETVTVNGMSCSHCEGRVNGAVSAIDGVKSVKASAKSNNCTIKFDETKTSIDAIKSTIKETGYEV